MKRIAHRSTRQRGVAIHRQTTKRRVATDDEYLRRRSVSSLFDCKQENKARQSQLHFRRLERHDLRNRRRRVSNTRLQPCCKRSCIRGNFPSDTQPCTHRSTNVLELRSSLSSSLQTLQASSSIPRYVYSLTRPSVDPIMFAAWQIDGQHISLALRCKEETLTLDIEKDESGRQAPPV